MWSFSVPSLKEFLTFSVKWYQLNYFICIKDFNAQTITSWKLNLFSFLLTAVIVHTWIMKEKDPSWYISVIRQTMGYQTPVFTHPFSWRLHITITYNLPHLRLTGTNVCWCCHGNSANIRSCLPNISDVKTQKRRNMIGIDMIRNKHIAGIFLE
jgi:hypothetical protein